MADQDFNIKVVTTADTRGIQQTSSELNKLKQQQSDAAATATAGLGGTAIGVGTIITLLTAAINKWKAFNDELDRSAELALKAQEKMRELGETILDIQDKARNAARVGTEPLYQSFIRLQQEIIKLKTEMSLLDLPRQGEEWKKLNAQLVTAQQQLKGVTSELQKQSAESAKTVKNLEKAAELEAKAAASFKKGAVETAQPQVQAALLNEERARQARQAGREKEAEQLQKTADQLKKGFTASQQEEYEGITKPVRLGRKAGPGESQAEIDDIERNRINFERQFLGEPPLPQGAAQGTEDLSAAIGQAIDKTMSKYWGP